MRNRLRILVELIEELKEESYADRYLYYYISKKKIYIVSPYMIFNIMPGILTIVNL